MSWLSAFVHRVLSHAPAQIQAVEDFATPALLTLADLAKHDLLAIASKAVQAARDAGLSGEPAMQAALAVIKTDGGAVASSFKESALRLAAETALQELQSLAK